MVDVLQLIINETEKMHMNWEQCGIKLECVETCEQREEGEKKKRGQLEQRLERRGKEW